MRNAILATLSSLLVALSPLAMAESLPSPRADWKAISLEQKRMLVTGFYLGWNEAIGKAASIAPNRGEIGELRYSGLDFLKLPVQELIDHFYSDPANEFVTWDDAIRLSVARAKGENIEAELQEERRVGLQMYKEISGHVPSR